MYFSDVEDNIDLTDFKLVGVDDLYECLNKADETHKL